MKISAERLKRIIKEEVQHVRTMPVRCQLKNVFILGTFADYFNLVGREGPDANIKFDLEVPRVYIGTRVTADNNADSGAIFVTEDTTARVRRGVALSIRAGGNSY